MMKIQAPTPTPTPGITPSTTAVTAPDPEPEFKKFAVPLITECKPIDFKSNSRAESAKKNLMGNTPDLSQPNFAGHFLLLKGDTIFQTYWLIADCNTGKISSELITGSAYFEKDSRLFKIYSSGNAASYHVWNESDNSGSH
jgi:hypothetical protein